MKRFGGDDDSYPAIPKLIAAGWNSRERLIFNWVTPSNAGYLLDTLTRDERVLRNPGTEKLLASRCMVSILTTIDRLNYLENLAIATIDVHTIGLSSDFMSGFLRDFNLHHVGSVCNSVGYPYYKGQQIKLKVQDSFLAAIIAFIYIIAPDAFTLERSW
jgi:hypothetical protein